MPHLGACLLGCYWLLPLGFLAWWFATFLLLEGKWLFWSSLPGVCLLVTAALLVRLQVQWAGIAVFGASLAASIWLGLVWSRRNRAVAQAAEQADR